MNTAVKVGATGSLKAGGAAAPTKTVQGVSSNKGGPGVKTEKKKPGQTDDLVRAITEKQAKAGQTFMGYVETLVNDYTMYSPAHADGSLTDLTGQYDGTMKGYFTLDVSHTLTKERWEHAKQGWNNKVKIENPGRLVKVRNNILEQFQGPTVNRDHFVSKFDEIVQLLDVYIEIVDERLLGEPSYMIPTSQLVSPYLDTGKKWFPKKTDF